MVEQLTPGPRVGEFAGPQPMGWSSEAMLDVQNLGLGYEVPHLLQGESPGYIKRDEHGRLKGKYALNLDVRFLYEDKMEMSHEGADQAGNLGEQNAKGMVTRVLAQIRTRGNSDIVLEEVVRDHRGHVNKTLLSRMRLEKEYYNWIQGNNLKQEGTPLQAIPGMSEDDIRLLNTMRIMTAEHLAVVNESSGIKEMLGSNWRKLKEKAVQLVAIQQRRMQQANATEKVTEQNEKIGKLEAENQALREQVARIERMLSGQGAPDPTDPSSVKLSPDAPVEEGAPTRIPTHDAPGS